MVGFLNKMDPSKIVDSQSAHSALWFEALTSFFITKDKIKNP
jgi:hypothetical protein